MSNLQTVQSPKIKILNGKMNTTSIDVANYFGRNHRDVTKKIERLDCSEKFATANFYAHAKTIRTGNGGSKKINVFDITRNGFTLLAMGFTGKKAMAFKEGYIEAFDTMEAELLKKYEQPAIGSTTLSPSQKRDVQEAVGKTGKFREVYGAIKSHFRVATYTELPADKYEAVMTFIGEWVPEAKVLASTDGKQLVHRANLLALKNRINLLAERQDKMMEVETNMMLACDAANKAHASLMAYRTAITDPVREANMLADSLVQH